MNKVILECTNVAKSYNDGNQLIQVLSEINLNVYPGEKIAIIGRSGSGKTTLLQLLGGLDLASHGIVKINGIDLTTLNDTNKANLRNTAMGFIYQLHHLIGEFTALENVCIPLLINQQPMHKSKQLATELLTEIGLGHRLHFYPNKLSGGERQRVAIARAIITKPSFILADEPTGNLDVTSANMAMDLLNQLCVQHKTAIIMVTHDLSFTKNFNRVYKLEQGKLV